MLVFLFLLIVSYFMYRIAVCVEKISGSATRLIDNVGDVAQPTVNGFKSLLSTFCGIATAAESAFN